MQNNSISLCPEKDLKRVLESAGKDDAAALTQLETLLSRYRDPRLFFLKGSLLAQTEQYPQARAAMQEAIKAAPDYAIARFQLGLLELTSGDANAALSTWGPLAQLKEDAYLSCFVRGIQHMIRDEFAPAIKLLEDGVKANQELPELNADMQKLISEMKHGGAAAKAQAPQEGAGEPTSMTQFLLEQFKNKRKLH